jgi:hypothetical protein
VDEVGHAAPVTKGGYQPPGGGTQTATFVGFPSVILDGSSGALTVDAAGRYGQVDSDFPDGLTTVDLPATPTSRTSNGASYGDGYTSLDGTYQWLEIGAKAYNSSAAVLREMGLVTLVIDLEA